jgi:hypothetical protein
VPIDSETLIRRLVAGDTDGVRDALRRPSAADGPVPLVLAALVRPDAGDLLERAALAARTSRDRQLVAIARTHLAGDTERLGVLVRDHLADHPDSLLAAWIATQHAGPDTLE